VLIRHSFVSRVEAVFALSDFYVMLRKEVREVRYLGERRSVDGADGLVFDLLLLTARREIVFIIIELGWRIGDSDNNGTLLYTLEYHIE
jgi:hypothetical protein